MFDDRKARALMIVIEKIIARNHQGLTSLDEKTFKLFELAKRVHYAKNEEEFQSAVADLAKPAPVPDYLKPPMPSNAGIRIVKTVTIQIGGGRTTDDIVGAAKELEGPSRPGYINPAISKTNMPSGHGRKRSVVVEWFKFDHDPTTEEVRTLCE